MSTDYAGLARKLTPYLRPLLGSGSSGSALIVPAHTHNYLTRAEADGRYLVGGSFDGLGLSYDGGRLDVGVSGLGLAVGADAVTLTSSSNPGAAASILATDASGFTAVVKLRTPLIDTATGDLTLTPAGNVVLSNGKAHRSVTFASGFAGSGWRIDQGVAEAAKTTAEVDNLVVRGRMSVYELLIHQIRATNGSIFVSNTGKAAAVTYISGASWQIDTDPEHGFAAGDLIRAQRFTGTDTYQCNMQVTSTATTKRFTATYITGNSPAAGMEFVRLGSATDSTRRGGVYLTADDSGAPFVDVFDGVDAFGDWNTAGVIKTRLGSLAGLGIGSAGEYGLFAGTGQATSDVYFKASTAGVVQNNVTASWYIGGSKTVEVNATGGLVIYSSSSAVGERAYKFTHSTHNFTGGLYAWHGGDYDNLALNAPSTGSRIGMLYLTAESGPDAAVGPEIRLETFSASAGAALVVEASRISIESSLAVDGAVTASGLLTVTSNGGGARLVGSDHFYLQFYPRGLATGRKAYAGFGMASTTNFTLANEDTGNLSVLTNGNSNQLVLLAGGNVGIGNATGSEKLHVSGVTLAQAFRATTDTGGSTSSGICYTGASQGVSTGTGTVKMGAGNNRNSDLWIKVYVGTTAYYIPAWSNIS